MPFDNTITVYNNCFLVKLKLHVINLCVLKQQHVGRIVPSYIVYSYNVAVAAPRCLVLKCRSFCSLFGNHLSEEERVECFANYILACMCVLWLICVRVYLHCKN